MKSNIFQKIAIQVYALIMLFICVYFVPYSGVKMGYAYNQWEDDVSYQNLGVKTYHSNILNDGFGTMSYLRFIIYLFIPTIILYFIYKYLERMNFLSLDLFKKKAKKEFYLFILFVSIIGGTILFLYVNNLFFNIVLYTNEEIKNNMTFAFLGSFILLYIFRPLFLMFKGMMKEVN